MTTTVWNGVWTRMSRLYLFVVLGQCIAILPLNFHKFCNLFWVFLITEWGGPGLPRPVFWYQAWTWLLNLRIKSILTSKLMIQTCNEDLGQKKVKDSRDFFQCCLKQCSELTPMLSVLFIIKLFFKLLYNFLPDLSTVFTNLMPFSSEVRSVLLTLGHRREWGGKYFLVDTIRVLGIRGWRRVWA